MNIPRFIPTLGRLCCAFAAVLALTSCDKIDESERLIYVKPADVSRKVLIEDFTGQRCIHCPRGTLVIEQLMEQYGDNIVAVGIHSGPLGFKGSATVLGLATDLGDTYYNYWQVQSQPSGVVNRTGGATEYTNWTSRVTEALGQTASLDITLDATLNAQTGDVDIAVETKGTNGPTEGNIQLWVLEDSITAMQLRFIETDNPQSGNLTDREYVHNHVLRAAVNGDWGEPFTLEEGEHKSLKYTMTPQSEWNVSNLSIVAFVYNSQGVAQVEKTHVIIPTD